MTMNNFKRTKLSIYTTVSEQLRRAREQQNLTIENCAQKLSIQKKYLQAVEDSKYETLPGEIYTRAWVKRFAQLLGLDLQNLLISYDKECVIRQKIMHKQESRQTYAINSWLWDFFTFRRLSTLLVIFLIIGYLSYAIYQTISPPSVVLNLPARGFRTQENSITIRGQTESGTIVTVNRQQIALDDQNEFTQEIILYEGLNTISIEAQKKHSRSYKQEIQIVKTSLPSLTTES